MVARRRSINTNIQIRPEIFHSAAQAGAEQGPVGRATGVERGAVRMQPLASFLRERRKTGRAIEDWVTGEGMDSVGKSGRFQRGWRGWMRPSVGF